MLLRAVESGEIVPLGSTRPARRMDVRLITATDADLEARVREGCFSEPLYRRLAKAEVRIPAVRQRRPDVGLLVLHFLRKLLSPADAHEVLGDRGVDPPWLSARTVARLALHRWSGNVREIETYVTQLVVASEGESHAQVDEVAHLLGDRIPPKRAPRVGAGGEGEPAAAISDDEFQRIFEAKHFVPAAVFGGDPGPIRTGDLRFRKPTDRHVSSMISHVLPNFGWPLARIRRSGCRYRPAVFRVHRWSQQDSAWPRTPEEIANGQPTARLTSARRNDSFDRGRS